VKPVKKKLTKEEKKITKEELSVSIGKVIREFRLSKKMSIESLSNETGLAYSQLSRI
jgi:ribosome-binding protein aMBF1 (putative translation factor)